LINVLLILSDHKISIQALRILLEHLLSIREGFNFFNSSKFIEKHHAHISIDQGRPKFNYLQIGLNGVIKFVSVVEDIGIAHAEFVAFILAKHVLVPQCPLLQLILVIIHNLAVA
jgi:hypothetical protein